MRRPWAVSILVSGLWLVAPTVTAASQTAATSIDAAAIYKERCAMCHGSAGDALAPSQNFADGEWKRGSSVKQLVDVIRDGVPGTYMAPFKGALTDAQIEALARYVRQFDPKLKARPNRSRR